MLARSPELTNVQRAWGLTEVGRLLAKTEPDRAAEMLGPGERGSAPH